MIPKVLHYCFGMSPDFGGKPWSLVHYACVKSAIERLKPTDALFYCEYEPTGPWWELTRSMVTVEKVRAPREIFGNPLMHGAHQADVLRLEKLLSLGGIYLDADVFVHSSFDSLLGNATVLGEERVEGTVVGLCNAVILAESGAPFLERWHSEYRWFRSKGHDNYWDEHSVRLPYQLSKSFPGEVTILPHSAFFWPTFTEKGLARIYNSAETIDLSGVYATHLWESPAWERYLEHLTPRRVRARHTNFHQWVRPIIERLPDDYGAPALADRLGRGIRQVRRRARSMNQMWLNRSRQVPVPAGTRNLQPRRVADSGEDNEPRGAQ